MQQTSLALEPTHAELMSVYNVKYYRQGEPGWSPRMRLSFDYFPPDDYYEAVVAKLVSPGSHWADIGCGRDIFPQHPELAAQLSSRAAYVYGIDPDPNIKENKFIADGFMGPVEDCDTARTFDVVTMRMVAEHIVNPDRAIGRIVQLLKPGGKLVIYTPYKWAPMSVIATIVPFKLHHPLKRLIWDAQARDTFPTAYKLNTRKDLHHYAGRHGLKVAYLRLLDDCSVLARYRSLNWLELSMRRILNRFSLGYFERCILVVMEKPATAS